MTIIDEQVLADEWKVINCCLLSLTTGWQLISSTHLQENLVADHATVSQGTGCWGQEPSVENQLPQMFPSFLCHLYSHLHHSVLYSLFTARWDHIISYFLFILYTLFMSVFLNALGLAIACHSYWFAFFFLFWIFLVFILPARFLLLCRVPYDFLTEPTTTVKIDPGKMI